MQAAIWVCQTGEGVGLDNTYVALRTPTKG